MVTDSAVEPARSRRNGRYEAGRCAIHATTPARCVTGYAWASMSPRSLRQQPDHPDLTAVNSLVLEEVVQHPLGGDVISLEGAGSAEVLGSHAGVSGQQPRPDLGQAVLQRGEVFPTPAGEVAVSFAHIRRKQRDDLCRWVLLQDFRVEPVHLHGRNVVEEGADAVAADIRLPVQCGEIEPGHGFEG